MDATSWEYRVATFKNPEIGRLQKDLDGYGRAGWELVSLTTTVKTMVNLTGNDLVAIFKRPSIEPVDRSAEPGLDTESNSGWM